MIFWPTTTVLALMSGLRSSITLEVVLNLTAIAESVSPRFTTYFLVVADVAFALAVNSVTDSVAVQWSLNLFRPALLGERITADCSVIHRGRRLLVVELEVHNSAGKLLAKGEATALPVGKDPSPSDPSSKDKAPQSSSSKDSAAKVPAAKDSQAKGRLTKDSAARDPVAEG